MFQNFQAWKLHSFEDYLTFLIVILAGIMIFKFAIQKIYKHRNDAYALKLVRKKLKYLLTALLTHSKDQCIVCNILFGDLLRHKTFRL